MSDSECMLKIRNHNQYLCELALIEMLSHRHFQFLSTGVCIYSNYIINSVE